MRAFEATGFADKERARAERAGVTILTPDQEAYPDRLRTIPDPPTALYVAGDPAWLATPSVGIVGSRNATLYGRTAAEALASQLVLRGLTIVSGFARGIDAAAHAAAARAGGPTVAALGCGVDIDYPREHDALRRAILARGCLVSEFPMGLEPTPYTFPQRNRIISGLSLGVIVVEATDVSGALVTARHAAEQGREVFAVPGNLFAPTSRGPHRLIRDGAKLVESAEDVLEELAAHFTPTALASADPVPVAGTVEARVWAALGPEPVHVDELARRLALPMRQLSSVLSVLEIKRAARQHPGKRFSRP